MTALLDQWRSQTGDGMLIVYYEDVLIHDSRGFGYDKTIGQDMLLKRSRPRLAYTKADNQFLQYPLRHQDQ